MPKQIDERVVEMRFDNSDFMNKVKPTISKLDELKKSLQLEGAAKEFDKLQNAADKVDMRGLGNVVDSVHQKFSVLETVAVGALFRIGDQAVQAGERLVKSLTIDPISQGFGEYELKMNSVQTIMASTGESLDTVNKYLEDLNTYADKTIYSFSDMTSNIGKFTNAGVKLEDAVKAIQGVSNEAAVSGANANEASRAMYNFAQALSAGYVKSIDWKSIENANMATVEFKDQLIQTALAMGTVVKEGDLYRSTTTDLNGKVSDAFDMTKNFNDSLAHQWLTTDVLVQALNNYSTDIRDMTAEEKKAYEEKLKSIGYTEEQITKIEELGQKAFDSAQDVKTFSQLIDTLKESVGSSWAQTFEIIFGDFEQAKKLWTSINNVVGGFLERQGEARNKFLQGWANKGGRANLLKGLSNAFKALEKVIEPIGKAFRNIFPPSTGRTLAIITREFKNLTEALIISDGTAQKIEKVFTGFFKIIRGGVDGVKYLGEGFVWLARTIKNSEKTQKILNNIVKLFNTIGTVCTPYINDAVQELESFKMEIETLVPQKIDEFITKFSDGMVDLSEVLANVDLSSPSKAMESFKKVLEKICELLTGNNSLNSYIKNAIDYLHRFGEAFSMDNIFGNFTKNIKGVSDILSGSLDIKNIKAQKPTSFLSQFQISYEVFVDWVKDKTKDLSKVFDQVSFGGLAAVVGGGGLLFSINKVANSISSIADKFGEIPKILGSVNGALKAYQDKLKAEKIKEIAKAILILAGALVVLSFADMDKVMKSATALGVLAAGLAYAITKLKDAFSINRQINDKQSALINILNSFSKRFGKAIKGLSRAVQLKAIGKMVKDIGVTVLLVAGSIALLANSYSKDPEAFNKAKELVAEIALAIVGIVAALELMNNKLSGGASNLKNAGIGVLALAGALSLIVGSVDKLFKMELPGDYKQKLGILAGILIGLGVLGKLIGSTSKVISSDQNLKSGVTKGPILALAAMLYVSVLALDKLFKMDLPGDYKQKLTILAGLFVGLGVVALAVGKASSYAKGALKAGGTIIAMAIFMGAAVASLYILTKMDADKLKGATIAFGAILLALTESIKQVASSTGNTKGAYKIILSMAAMIAAMTIALGVLSMIPFDSLMGAATALGAVMMAIGYSLKQAQGNDYKKSLKTMIGMIVMLIFVAGSLYALASRPWDQMLAAGIAMGAVLLSFTKMLEMVSSRTGLKKEKINEVVKLIGGSCLAIGIALYAISKNPWDQILAAGVAMGAVILAFSKSFQIISNIKTNSDAVDDFLLLIAGSVIPLTFALYTLALQPWDQMLAAAAAIAIVMATMTKTMETCANVGDSAKKALPAVLLLLACLTPLLGVVGVLALMSKLEIPPEEMITMAVSLSLVMGALLGVMAGLSAIGPAAKGAYAGIVALDVLVADLIAVFAALGGLSKIDGFNELINDGGQVFAKIGEILGNFVGSFVSGAIVGAASALPKVAMYLVAFGAGIKAFMMEVKGIGTDAIDAVKSLVEVMLLMTGAELLGGLSSLISFFTGGNSFKKIGEQLKYLIPAFVEFADKTKDINAQHVKTSAEALGLLFKALGEMPNEGGLISKLTGDNVIDEEYANNIAAMGKALTDFYNSTIDVNYDSIKMATDSLVLLFDAFSQMPNSGGLLGDIMGENDISEDYAKNMVAMGKGLNDFCDAIPDVNYDSVKLAADSFTALFNAFSELPNSGGLLGDIMGENTISEDYANNMIAMGKGLNDFCGSISAVDYDKVKAATDSFTVLFNAFSKIPNDGGLLGMIVGNNDISDFGENLQEFGVAFYKFSLSVTNSDINFGTLRTAMNELSKLADLANVISNLSNMYAIVDFINSFQSIGSDSLDGFLDAFEGAGAIDKVKTTMTTMMDTMTTVIQNYYPIFLADGTESANEYMQGIIVMYDEASNVGTALANKVIEGINEIVPKFLSLGEDSGQGFINGLESKMPKLTEIGNKIGQMVLEASKKAVDSHSPSKKYEELGKNCSIGLVNGINRSLYLVAKAGEDMSDKATDKVRKGISRVSDALVKDLDSDPVIRPVIDLSNVHKSAKEIDSLFNRSISGLSVKASSVSDSVAIYDAARRGSNYYKSSSQDSKSKDNPNYSFVQNNYSPKALSQTEIYRQTRNLFSMAKKG